jgi:hypothetical protein
MFSMITDEVTGKAGLAAGLELYIILGKIHLWHKN